MSHLIAIGLGLLFCASAAFAADTKADSAQPAAGTENDTKMGMRTGRRIHRPAATADQELKSKAAKDSTKAIDSTGKDTGKASK